MQSFKQATTTITHAVLKQGMGKYGGWTDAQLAALGIVISQGQKWKQDIIGKEISTSAVEKFLALKDIADKKPKVDELLLPPVDKSRTEIETLCYAVKLSEQNATLGIWFPQVQEGWAINLGRFEETDLDWFALELILKLGVSYKIPSLGIRAASSPAIDTVNSSNVEFLQDEPRLNRVVSLLKQHENLAPLSSHRVTIITFDPLSRYDTLMLDRLSKLASCQVLGVVCAYSCVEEEFILKGAEVESVNQISKLESAVAQQALLIADLQNRLHLIESK